MSFFDLYVLELLSIPQDGTTCALCIKYGNDRAIIPVINTITKNIDLVLIDIVINLLKNLKSYPKYAQIKEVLKGTL